MHTATLALHSEVLNPYAPELRTQVVPDVHRRCHQNFVLGLDEAVGISLKTRTVWDFASGT